MLLSIVHEARRLLKRTKRVKSLVSMRAQLVGSQIAKYKQKVDIAKSESIA